MKPSRRFGIVAAGTLAAGVLAVVFTPTVEAIVGAPLTPVSVGGVARRTARRTTVVVASSASHAQQQQAAAAQQQAQAEQAQAQAAQASAAAAQASAAAASAAAASAAASAPSGVIAQLPAGCVPAGELFQCGSVYYRPYMQGTTVVYVRVSG